MRVLFLVHGLEDASVRYRVDYLLPQLRVAGGEAEVVAVPRPWGQRRALFERAADFDAVVVQRRLFVGWQLAHLRRRARRLVYDFDDALQWPDSVARRPFSLTRWLRFRRMLRAADAVMAGSPILAEMAAAAGADPVVVPTAVDLGRYPRVPPAAPPGPPEAPLRVGWIGSHVTLFYLEDILPDLEAAARRLGGLVLVVIADRFPAARGALRVEACPWSAAGEAAALGRLHAGLGPLRDDRWSRGKCALKVLQYMAAGVPPLVSPVGANALVVRDGAEGLHARGPDGWGAALAALAEDPARRARLGSAARRRVEREFSTAAVAPAWLAAIAGGPGARRRDAGA